MFACIGVTKGLTWYLHSNSLTLLRYYYRKHQGVSIQVTQMGTFNTKMKYYF